MRNQSFFPTLLFSKFNIKHNFSAIKGFVFGLALFIVLAAGVVYAWNAVWHETDWIDSGYTIKARELGETLEYLKQRIDELEENYNNIKNMTGTVVDGCDKYNPSANPSTTNPFKSLIPSCWGDAYYENENSYGCHVSTIFYTESPIRPGSCSYELGSNNDGYFLTENCEGSVIRVLPNFLCIKSTQ